MASQQKWIEPTWRRKMESITWLGHARFRIALGGYVIYTDPYEIQPGPAADLILVSHDHRDHCSVADIKRIVGETTAVVTIAACAEGLSKELSCEVRVIRPGEILKLKDMTVQAVPAYNVNKFRSPGIPYHPRGKGYVGFVLTAAGTRIYHAGDTDVIPEMRSIQTDIALLPVSGLYVMTAEEAAEASEILTPRLAIPMHYGKLKTAEGKLVGSMNDARMFKELSRVPVQIPAVGEELTL
jgi:L-ascorbate metabolism protein UlaG (beta-lactamase superfamily)